ncbi:MAG TPA: hypothetical protein VGO40_22985 [Longimicrobium sp.]|jgi:hypothetical protein|nr:hypothetical protein [Longimicrobium sp.]
MSDDREVIEALKQKERASRGYADWDAWADSATRDLGIGQDFATALQQQHGIQLGTLSPVPRGSDPPDLLTNDGIGIELTELVDEKEIQRALRIKRGQTDRLPYRDWSSLELRDALARRIREKDKTLIKQPASVKEFWLVIHTDEPALVPAGVAASLSEWVPMDCQQISRCYLLMSYFPEYGRPVFPIPVCGSA